jgi:hypothetical protein
MQIVFDSLPPPQKKLSNLIGQTCWWLGVKTNLQADQLWFCNCIPGQSVLLFLLAGMQTWIIAVEENGYTLRLAWKPPVYLVYEKGYEFEAYEWPWTKTDIPIALHFFFFFYFSPLPSSFNSSNPKLQLANLWRISENISPFIGRCWSHMLSGLTLNDSTFPPERISGHFSWFPE